MKALFFNLILSGISLASFAQFNDRALARVHYSLLHVRDTLHRDKPYQENMMLIVGKNASLFTSYDRLLQRNKIAAYIDQPAKEQGGNLTHFSLPKGIRRPVTNADFYAYASQNKAFIVEHMMTKYLIADSIAPINWKITNDTANFSGISCKKAFARFKGRNWIAWYAPALPFQSGPWKLQGLPGLIIEAFDDKRDIQFIFSGMESVTNRNSTKPEKVALGGGEILTDDDFYLGTEINLPRNAIKVTRAEIARMRQAMAENPMAVANSQLAGQTSIKTTMGTSTNSKAAKPIYNNPIELPEPK